MNGTALRPLTLCADDYGLDGSVSLGILRLSEAGRISATSCMAAARDWPALARDLPDDPTRFALGLHLTLTEGEPLGPMPAVAPLGAFPALGRLLSTSLRGGLPAGEVRCEIARQLDSFERALGRPPDFVDGHQHVHVLPGVRGPLLAELAGRGLAGRLWLRDPSDTAQAIASRRASVGKALVVGALAIGFAAATRRAGFACNRGFSGFSSFAPEPGPAAEMDAALSVLGPAPLCMCHPGAGPPDGADAIGPARVREYDFLRSDEFAGLLARRHLQLVPQPGAIRP